MTTVDKTQVFRDATYSAATQEKLRSLLLSIERPSHRQYEPLPSEIAALREVTARWDANDVTEFIEEEANA